MPWPGITDFSEAVQNPRLCFKGTELESATVSVNQRGMPLVFSGSFACVYPVSAGNRTYAVQCFTREVSDQQARYGELSNYLLNVLPPSFVHFEYRENGISLGGAWYPIVKMEWVDGELLSGFTESRLNRADTLRRIAAQWRGGPTASLRDMSDEVLRGVADTGGVACVLAATPRTAQERHAARLKRDRDLANRYKDPFDLAAAKLADAQIWSTKLDLDTIDYAVNIAGIDHIGLSSHAQSVPQWKEFTEALFEHGYTREDASKILGENVLRVLRETL